MLYIDIYIYIILCMKCKAKCIYSIYIYIMVDWVLDDANGKVDGRWYLENVTEF